MDISSLATHECSSSAEKLSEIANSTSKAGTEPPLQEELFEDAKEKTEGQTTPSPPSAATEAGELRPDGKRVLREIDCPEILAVNFPRAKKWRVCAGVCVIQLSMNFNASVYPSVIPFISQQFRISKRLGQVSQMLFLILYAVACELWAPWSEEFGRWKIMQVSLFLVNVWQILGARAQNYASVALARSLGGLSSGGGSVTLGIVADMWESNEQGHAVALVALASVSGLAMGPIFGGVCGEYLRWQWTFWIQLIFGVVTQIVHFVLVPETRSSLLLDREARRRRELGEDPNIYGPGEVPEGQLTFAKVLEVWKRPFVMFATEPIVLFLSLLSGFSDALTFTCMESFPLVFEQWGFSTARSGCVFGAVLAAYGLAYCIHLPDVARQKHLARTKGESARYAERRLQLLLFLAPLGPIGLIGFAMTSKGPEHNHWAWPVFFIKCIAVANYSVYMATIDYMMAAYGPYSALATGGNGFARDFLAGVSAMYATPLYRGLGEENLFQWASILLGLLAVLFTIPIYVFYWKGPQIRARSKFAQVLAADKEANEQISRVEDDEDVQPELAA